MFRFNVSIEYEFIQYKLLNYKASFVIFQQSLNTGNSRVSMTKFNLNYFVIYS